MPELTDIALPRKEASSALSDKWCRIPSTKPSGWPLTRKQDAELAYLAQYEQHGPTVPFGGRRTGYGVEPDHAVVLAVPRFAARHAADHTGDDRQRIVLGPEPVAGTAEPDERDVLALLRGAYPYLPTLKATGRGPGPRPW